MVEPIEKGHAHIETARMAPAGASLPARRKEGSPVTKHEPACLVRNHRPALCEQRQSTWRHARHPDAFKRFTSCLDRRPRPPHRQKFGVDDVQVVAWGETV